MESDLLVQVFLLYARPSFVDKGWKPVHRFPFCFKTKKEKEEDISTIFDAE